MDHYYSDPPRYEANNPEDMQHDAQVLIDSFIRPIGHPQARSASGLPVPFSLPQIGAGFDTPIARGYSPVLYQVGIPPRTFLDFVDGLNMAMISSPPLQVIDRAGMLIGFVCVFRFSFLASSLTKSTTKISPHWTFALAGNLMQTGAQVGMHVMSKTLSDRYLRAANERIFAPLGLRARLVKTRALRVLVDHPDAGKPEPSKLAKFGQGAGEVILHLPLPLTKKLVRALMDKPPAIDPRITDPLERRLMGMHGYILPVEHGPALPPPSNPTGTLDKMNGFAVGKSRGKLNKKEQDAAARREILAGMPVSREGGMTKKDREMAKKVAKGKDKKKLRTKVEDDARHEHHAFEGLIWLVIINEADGEWLKPCRFIELLSKRRWCVDEKIAGKESMDNSSDNLAFSKQQLEETRGRYLEESGSSGYASEDYDHKSHASGSKLRR